MSNFAITYANYCGVRLPKTPPIFPTTFFPLPPGDYITVHAGAGDSSREYSYISDALFMAIPFLKKKGLKVIQVGAKHDPKIIGAIDMRGSCTIRQSAFIVKGSKLHVGSDSLWSHVAGSFNVPSVILFAPNPSAVTKPHYRSKYFYAIEPNYGNQKPNFAVGDNPKMINTIKPETVATAIVNHFDENEKIPFETIRIGEHYKIVQYDFVPDCVFNLKISDEKLVCRLDVVFNLNYAQTLLKANRCVIMTNRAIPTQFLDKFKTNIETVVYMCDKNIDINFVKEIDKTGIHYLLITKESDPKIKSKMKYDLFDFNDLLSAVSPNTDGVSKDMWFKTNRFVLGRGQLYDSIYHYKVADNIDFGKSRLIGEALNNEDFIANLESYYIFKKL